MDAQNSEKILISRKIGWWGKNERRIPPDQTMSKSESLHRNWAELNTNWDSQGENGEQDEHSPEMASKNIFY